MTPDSSAWPVRTLDDSDWPAFIDVDSNAFGNTFPEEMVEADREFHEPGRGIGAFDGDRLVGIATAYPFGMTVPGGSVPAAGVSWVGVLPTHRRRGVLSALMDHQLTDLHDSGREPVAVLWASEPAIYGRYGYGQASSYWSLTVGTQPHRALRGRAPGPRAPAAARPGGRLEAHRRGLRRCRGAPAGHAWPGTSGGGGGRCATPRRCARAPRRCAAWWPRTARGVRGYARYSTTQSFGEDFGRGKVRVREVLADDSAALADPVPLPVRPRPDGQHRALERARRRPGAALVDQLAPGQAVVR